MKSLKYIVKKVVIGVLIVLILGFINKCDVKADVVLGGTTLSSSNYKVLPAGNQTMTFRQNKVYNLSDVPEYFLITLCADTQRIQNWYINNYTLRSINFFDTNYKCMYPNSSYSGGHVVYVYGTYDVATACGSGTTSCMPTGSVTFYNPAQKSYALLAYEESLNSITIDYASQSIISDNQTLISKQDQLISQQSELITKQQATNDSLNFIRQQNINSYNMQKSESDETQQKLDGLKSSTDNLDNTIKDDGIDDPTNSINGAKDKVASNGTITNLVLLPVTLFTKILSTINGSCTTYNLGNLMGHNLILPCINISDYLGSTTWNIIDVIISGMLIYAISRKFVKVFNEFSQLKEGDIID